MWGTLPNPLDSLRLAGQAAANRRLACDLRLTGSERLLARD